MPGDFDNDRLAAAFEQVPRLLADDPNLVRRGAFFDARFAVGIGAIPFDAAKEPFKGQFIDYDDPRLTRVATGYALQAAMYHITKEPFCENPDCRLFNAHWQAELMRAQVQSHRLCRRHREIARRVARAEPPAKGLSREPASARRESHGRGR